MNSTKANTISSCAHVLDLTEINGVHLVLPWLSGTAERLKTKCSLCDIRYILLKAQTGLIRAP